MKISYDSAINSISQLFKNEGCSAYASICIATSLTQAEVCGISSHGFRMIDSHLKRIRERLYNISDQIIIEKQTPSFTLVNSNNLVGMVSADRCIDVAINNAKKSGVHIVFANNANTFSAAFTYVNKLAENGLIGIAFCNSPAQMAPLGGCEKMLGTNPFAFSIPSSKELPIVFDMATSIVAKSKINEAVELGQEIPMGWALSSNGLPTTDPLEAVKGLILPMAGPKGYGLSVMIDMISGLCSGANYLNGVGRFYGSSSCMNVGHTFIAIDPIQIYGADFYNQVDLYINKVHSSKKVEGKTILMPGEDKVIKYYQAKKNGIEINCRDQEILHL